MIALLRQVSWPQWRHHPWRHAAALLAVVLGVALAFSVQLINQSALGEFSAAVRSVNGEPDFELRGQRGGFDEALYARVAAHPQVALASPVVELETLAAAGGDGNDGAGGSGAGGGSSHGAGGGSGSGASGRSGSGAGGGSGSGAGGGSGSGAGGGSGGGAGGGASAAGSRRVPLRVLGVDALVVAGLSPALLPRLNAGAGRTALLDPGAVALNESARRQLVDGARLGSDTAGPGGAASAASAANAGRAAAGASADSGAAAANAANAGRATAEASAAAATRAVNADGAAGTDAAVGRPATIRVQTPGGNATRLRVHGSVAAGGAPLAVMDIAGAQAVFGWLGRLSRIDVRLAPGADRDAVIASLKLADFAAQGVRAAAPGEAAQRVSNLSRAYRVNLTVLALVALFTGAFLVFSILALSVAKRQPELALLGVLGLSARERLRLVLAESALLGAVGGVLGLLLGTALAALALRLLAGDLGGGYFPGVAPTLHLSAAAAAVYGALGVVAALVGGWLPARAAQRIAPAQALKGLGDSAAAAGPAWVGPALLAIGAALCFAPPVFEVPLAAYVAVALLLLGGIACVPAGVGLLVGSRGRFAVPGRRGAPSAKPRNALVLLAVERARHQRQTATIAVAGVVASLSLAVALTVMVTSFRGAIIEWLDVVLPADLYARAAAPGNPGNGSGGGGGALGDLVTLPPALVAAAARLPGVARAEAQRVSSVQIDAARPSVALIARPLADPARALPLVGELRPVPPGDGATAVYVSEAMVDLYGAAPGTRFALPLPGGGRASVFVRGVWRDYARQFGAVTLDAADYRRLTGDSRVNDLALWLVPGTDPAAVQAALRRAAGALGVDGGGLEFASPGEIRALSLRIFDRSFAVTYWLQAVAIAIGLFGIAASFSAQVLARRKEFGLLAHLGLTRRQVLTVVAAEGAVWTATGALLGLLLGVAVSVVLVEVVNPQSFHWTMELRLPWARLAALGGAVMAAGTLTAWLAARHATGRDTALAVKEDW